MPSDGNFSFSVLIGGMAVPEYHQDGKIYIESNLWTPVSYEQEVRERVGDEMEVQKWPVTPYEVSVRSGPLSEESWFCLYVDGTRVGTRVLGHGNTTTFKGFQDRDGTKEFLFALPRFARDWDDRVDAGRLSKVGTIEVVRRGCTFVKKDWDSQPSHDMDFDQANKKDTRDVTGGKYTMSTTKKGRCIEEIKPRSKLVHYYTTGQELGRLSVRYHMGHTLTEDFKIKLSPMDWSQARSATS